MSRLAIYFLVVLTLGMAILLAWLGWATIPTNLLGWFLLLTGLAYFIGVIVVYWVRRVQFWAPRAGGKVVNQEKNDVSFWFIVLGMVGAFYLPPIEYLSSNLSLARGRLQKASAKLERVQQEAGELDIPQGLLENQAAIEDLQLQLGAFQKSVRDKPAQDAKYRDHRNAAQTILTSIRQDLEYLKQVFN